MIGLGRLLAACLEGALLDALFGASDVPVRVDMVPPPPPRD